MFSLLITLSPAPIPCLTQRKNCYSVHCTSGIVNKKPPPSRVSLETTQCEVSILLCQNLSLLLEFEHGVYTVDQFTQPLFQLIPECFLHGGAWTAEKDTSQMPLQPGFCQSYTLSQTSMWSLVKWGKSGSTGCIHFPGTD